MSPRTFALAALAATFAASVACFPDFQIAEQGAQDGSANGSDGSASDGASARDGSDARDASDAPSSVDGGAGDGAVVDGNTFDAAASKLIPRGSFVFHDPGGLTSTNATLSHDFYLDAQEMTVARLRAWVAAAKPTPTCPAAGPCTLDPGGPYEQSVTWDNRWNTFVAAEKYKDDTCQAGNLFVSNYTTYNGADDAVPLNCVNWYQAVALCWWDGGKRLATQVEWQYEATGRGRGRTYPWGDTPAPTDCTLAIWRNGATSSDIPPYNGCKFPKKPGSAPAGMSFDGVDDLAGSVSEWTWDWYDNTYPNAWPPDYAGPAQDAGASSKMVRGGSWTANDVDLHTNRFDTHSPQNAFNDVGVRCVKTKL